MPIRLDPNGVSAILVRLAASRNLRRSDVLTALQSAPTSSERQTLIEELEAIGSPDDVILLAPVSGGLGPTPPRPLVPVSLQDGSVSLDDLPGHLGKFLFDRLSDSEAYVSLANDTDEFSVFVAPPKLTPPVTIRGVDISSHAANLSESQLADLRFSAELLFNEASYSASYIGSFYLSLNRSSIDVLCRVLRSPAELAALFLVAQNTTPLNFRLRDCLTTLADPSTDRARTIAGSLEQEAKRTGMGATLALLWFRDPGDLGRRVMLFVKEYPGQAPEHFYIAINGATSVDVADLLVKAGTAVSKWGLIKDTIEAIGDAPIEVGWLGVTQRFNSAQAQTLANAFSDKEIWGILTTLISLINGFAGKIFGIVAAVFSLYATWIRETDTGKGVVMRLVPIVFTVVVEAP